MITDLVIGVFSAIEQMLLGWLPVANQSCNLPGLANASSFLGQVISTTAPFIPWADILIILGIMTTIWGFKLIMIVVHLIWP